MDEKRSDGSDFDDAPEDIESQGDDFTTKNAAILGGFIGWAYREDLKVGKHQRKGRKKNSKGILIDRMIYHLIS